jgi:hydroxyacyl-ACP dehydratase HTD2-like protein with hotdog domain
MKTKVVLPLYLKHSMFPKKHIHLGVTNRRSRPVERVACAMWRISKNRWIHPKKVSEMALRFSQLASNAPHTVRNHAIHVCCEWVGMIKGWPPLVVEDPFYIDFIKYCKTLSPNDKTGKGEYTLLNYIIRGMK